MTEDRELQAQIDRAEHASRLLTDELLQEAMEAIRKEVMQEWVDCPVRDTAGKEICWQLMKSLGMFQGLLTGYIESGKLAQINLKAFQERKGLLRRVIG